MTDLLIRRDEKLPAGTKLAYRVVEEYLIDVAEWLDPDEDEISIEGLEHRLQLSGPPAFQSVRDALRRNDVTSEATGEATWVMA